MKFILFYLVTILCFSYSQAQTTKLDAQSVELAYALLQPKVRECIDTALTTHKVFKDTFSINEIITFSAQEPLFPGDATNMQNVVHYVLQSDARASIGGGNTKNINLKFDVKISSGTGILTYSCSADVQ